MTLSAVYIIVNYLCLNIVYRDLYNQRAKHKYMLIIPLILFVGYIPVSFFSNIASLIYHIVMQSVGVILIAYEYNHTLFTVGRLYIFLYFVNTMFSGLFANIFSLPDEELYIVELPITFFILLTVDVVVKSKRAENIRNTILWMDSRTKTFLVALFIVFALCLSLVFEYEFYFDYLEDWIVFISSMIAVLSILTSIAFPLIVVSSSRNSYLKNLNELYIKQIDAQTNHYKATAESMYELRRFRHDYKNTNIALTSLLKENKTQEALNLLSDSNESLTRVSEELQPFDTGNDIADALLKEKQIAASQNNIAIKFSGAIPSSSIKASDICVILGNAVDNAIEACLKIEETEEKIISIKAVCRSGFMFLTIENPVNETVKIKDNIIHTNKAEKELHGYGIPSIRETIKKYDGELELSCENNIFRLSADLSLTGIV